MAVSASDGARSSPGPGPARVRASGSHPARYRRILWFAARQLLQLWWFELVLPRLGLTAISERTRRPRMRRLARRFHALAVELGGLMIKVGQFLSSRLDVLPPEITAELAGLQDEVPAVPFEEIRALAEAELGAPLTSVYRWFDETPVAAASLGQVHRAQLSEADARDCGFADVVVKVQRPGIDGIVAVDLAALRRVAGWLRRIRLVSDRVDAPALVEEFARTSREEVDYLHEAANAARFADDVADDPRIHVPEVAWERSTRRVLTLSDVTAIKINDVDALRAAGIDPGAVASVFAEVMFDQVFTHGRFHADPHPGNIFVTPRREGDDPGAPAWRLTFVDFGMMGQVPAGLRDGLRSIVIALAGRDSRRLVDAVQEIGMLLPSADTGEFERAVTALFARFGGMGFAELRDVDPRELRDFGIEFGDLMRRMPFQLPEGFLLLIRAMSLTSGMCSGLDPRFNVWDAVEPYAGRLLREETGNAAKALAREAMENAGVLWRLPGRVDALVERLERDGVSLNTSRLEHRLDVLSGIGRRVISAVLFTGLLIGGMLVMDENVLIGSALLGGSAIALAHALFAGPRRRRPPR